VKDNAEDKDIREAIISATELVRLAVKEKEAQFDVFFAKLDEKKAVIEHLREENGQYRVNSFVVHKECMELKEERDMLADENSKMAEFLLVDYTQDDVDNITKGFSIDKGDK
jgi:hypothetical protein